MKKKQSTRLPLTDTELARLTADDFLRLKLTDDEKSRLREINAERGRVRQLEIARLREASKPLVEALHAAGFPVNGVWDFVNTRERYDAALPVLAAHLERDYPPEILEGIARAMAVPGALPWRNGFIRLYRQQPPLPKGFRDGLAVAIGNTTGPANVWKTMELMGDASLGSNRVLMLAPFAKVRDPEIRKALLELRESDAQIAPGIGQLGWVRKYDKEHRTQTRIGDRRV